MMGQTVTGHAQWPLRYKAAYLLLLLAVSGWILVIFLKPTSERVGINQYDRSKFLDMVEGTAYKPFVYRTLLPTTTRVIVTLTPAQLARSLSNIVEENRALSGAFARFRWETSAAYPYFVACVLMLLSLMGFAHYTSALSLRVCGIGDSFRMRASLAVLALLGLPAFFSFTAYPYDPPQLFLFTLALYLLASQRIGAFVVAFCLCCLNKETAVLLVPVFALTCRGQLPRRRYIAVLVVLVFWYLLVRTLVVFAFRDNPGSFVEFHLVDHNLSLFVSGWSFSGLVTALILAVLVFYRWKEKPDFLRVSFVTVLVPLVVLSLFLGYLNEWRGYFEAYPLAFGLAVDTVRRLDVALGRRGKAGWP